MESRERLFRIPFVRPEWLNNANVRTAGVYLAGALVRHPVSTAPLELV